MIKKSINVILPALGLLAGSILSSCSQDDMPTINNSGNVLVKAPKIIAYSGETVFGENGTRSLDPSVQKPPMISYGSQEFNDVKAFFTNNDQLRAAGQPVEGGQFLDIDEAFEGWTDYWVQTLEQQTNVPDAYHVINNLGIWNHLEDEQEGAEGHPWDVREWTQQGNQYFGNEHFKLINKKDIAPDRLDAAVRFENWPIVDFSYTTYLEHPMAIQYRGKYSYILGKKPGLLRKSDGAKTPPYRIAKIDGYDEIYVAFYVQNLDYYHNQFGGGASGGITKPLDWGDDQWDVILKLTKIEELCEFEDCHHPVHAAGYCPICVALGKDSECTVNAPEEQPEETPETTEVAEGENHNNEVEVNLHGVDRNGQYLESHLSIHVRYAGDVEVFIPVPVQYTCEADDMDIVMKHEANHMTHTSTYTLKDSETSQYGPLTVSITVQYEVDGIRITTSGVTQEVIDWCAEKCNGDGITFEVWNYYNDPKKVAELPNGGISLDELVYLLNRATVRFLGAELPDYYINAFGKDGNTDISADCTVEIVEDQAGEYGNYEVGSHLNGSEFNHIYSR